MFCLPPKCGCTSYQRALGSQLTKEFLRKGNQCKKRPCYVKHIIEKARNDLSERIKNIHFISHIQVFFYFVEGLVYWFTHYRSFLIPSSPPLYVFIHQPKNPSTKTLNDNWWWTVIITPFWLKEIDTGKSDSA